MKIYDTSYGPDTFGRIRMGLIQEMILSYVGYSRPEPGDQLRISCAFRGVVRDVCLVSIVTAVDSYDEPEAVLIRISTDFTDDGVMSKSSKFDTGFQIGSGFKNTLH